MEETKLWPEGFHPHHQKESFERLQEESKDRSSRTVQVWSDICYDPGTHELSRCHGETLYKN